jgi:hypothetical protein
MKNLPRPLTYGDHDYGEEYMRLIWAANSLIERIDNEEKQRISEKVQNWA